MPSLTGEFEETAGGLRDAGGGRGHCERLERVYKRRPHSQTGSQEHFGYGPLPLSGE